MKKETFYSTLEEAWKNINERALNQLIQNIPSSAAITA